MTITLEIIGYQQACLEKKSAAESTTPEALIYTVVSNYLLAVVAETKAKKKDNAMKILESMTEDELDAWMAKARQP